MSRMPFHGSPSPDGSGATGPPSPDGFGAPSEAAPDGFAMPGMKLTHDDVLLFPDDGQRHELIDGEHYITPSPNIRHQEISGRLFLLIGAWLQEHPVGRAFYAPLDVVFSRFDVVEPDLLYVSNERAAALLAGQHVTGAPDIVVEIASPATRKRDETIKRQLYEGSSVAEYWVVDPDTDAIRVYKREGDCFARAVELSSEAGDVFTTPILPGLEIPLSRVFRA
jgi:Uma2 family endonuclease